MQLTRLMLRDRGGQAQNTAGYLQEHGMQDQIA